MFLKNSTSLAVILAALLLMSCGEKRTPNRDEIPRIRAQVYDLQVAVKAKDRAAIDSLLSVQILDLGLSSDSLLNFVFNFDGAYFPFEQFGNYRIIYNDDKARIDCYLMDSTSRSDRPFSMTMVREHGLWLLKRFQAELPDSMGLETVDTVEIDGD
jgi:hypothetical protein